MRNSIACSLAALALAAPVAADVILPGQTAHGPSGGAGGASPAKGGGAGGRATSERSGTLGGASAGAREPARWIAPCAARMEGVRDRLQRREFARVQITANPEAETVTVESTCAESARPSLRCDNFWAMVSVYDERHEAPVEWSNHKNGAKTSAWDLRRRADHLEGWVEVNGERAQGAIPILQRAVDACLALGDAPR